VQVPAFEQVARFHFVTRGECWVQVEGQDSSLQLGPGDLVVIPRGAAHVLKDHPARQAAALDDVIEKSGFRGEGALVYGGGESSAACKLVCGHFAFDAEVQHPLLDALPAYLHIPAAVGVDYSWLESALRFVAHEAESGQPGSDAILRRLAEIIFVQTLRSLDADENPALRAISGLMDKRLSGALRAIHGRPGENWSLDALAREAAMSRTRFAVRFRDTIGMAPMEYLTLWRMQVARQLILQTSLPMIEIASRVGYTSESAFSRAFHRQVGKPPGSLRRRQTAGNS
jgi:AraC-like DNA-binding protein